LTSDPAVIRPQHDLLDDLWRLSSATTGTILLALLLAATLAVAALFPQEPAGLQPAAEQHWLAAAAGTYGGLGTALRTLGIFNVQEGIWLRILLAAMAFHLLLRIADQARYAWGTLRRSAPAPSPRPGLTTVEITLPYEAGNARLAVNQVADALAQRFQVSTIAPCDPPACVYARRHSAGGLGPLLGYLGALVVLIGLLVNGLYGWQAADLALAPGGETVLAPAPNTKIELSAIGGTERAAVSAITVTRDGITRAGALNYAWPFRWGNLWIAQRATGPALAVSAQDAAGKALELQRQTGSEPAQVLSLAFTASETEQTFLAPAQSIAFRAVSYPSLPERGFSGPVFLVEAYRGDNPSSPILVQFVSDTKQVAIDGVTYTLRREQHAVFQAAYQPGLIVLLTGGLLLLVAAVLALWWGPVETWVELGNPAALAAAAAESGLPARVSVATLLDGEAELARVIAALPVATPPEAAATETATEIGTAAQAGVVAVLEKEPDSAD
jgi:hypothetical protein